MDNRLHILKLGLILPALILLQCKSNDESITTYDHDQVYVEMMVDLTLTNKIHGKVLYSQRDLMVDTLLDQIEQIHGRSIQDFDTYLLKVKSNDKVYAEFLDSVQVTQKRLVAKLLEENAEGQVEE